MSNYNLTEIFPEIDESILGYVYVETNGNLEKSINLLLQMIQDSKNNVSNEPTIVTNHIKNKEQFEEKTENNNDLFTAQTLSDEILAKTIQDMIMFDYINNDNSSDDQNREKKKSKKKIIKNKKNFMKKFGKKFKDIFSKFTCSACACASAENIQRDKYKLLDMDENLDDNVKIESIYDDFPENDDKETSCTSINLEQKKKNEDIRSESPSVLLIFENEEENKDNQSRPLSPSQILIFDPEEENISRSVELSEIKI